MKPPFFLKISISLNKKRFLSTGPPSDDISRGEPNQSKIEERNRFQYLCVRAFFYVSYLLTVCCVSKWGIFSFSFPSRTEDLMVLVDLLLPGRRESKGSIRLLIYLYAVGRNGRDEEYTAWWVTQRDKSIYSIKPTSIFLFYSLGGSHSDRFLSASLSPLLFVLLFLVSSYLYHH